MPQVTYQIISSVSLSSSYYAYTYNDGSHSTSTPSTDSASYGFSYAGAGIPDGSTINSTVFRVESFGSPLHGTSIRGVRVNGTDVTDSIPSATDVDIKPYLTTGGNTITLRFKSGTSNTSYPSKPPTTDPNDQRNSSSLAFNDVKVVINYTPPYTAPSVTTVRLNGTTAVQYGAASSSMTLSWDAVNGNYNAITSYLVYRSVNGGAYSLLQSGIAGTSLSVSLPGTAGQKHQYYVVAIGEYSNSAAAYSPQVYAYSSPSAPTAVSVSPSSVAPGASVSLSWSGANAGVGVGISSYSIRRSTSSGGTYTEVTTSTAASKSFTAPATAGTYYYKVLAYGSVSGYNSPLSSAYATLTVQNPRSTFTLDKTTLSMDNSTQITATISAADSGYTHTVRWYIDGTYTQTNTKSAGVASDTFKCPLSWNGAFPSASGGTAYCLLTTYSGGIAVGTYSKSFSVSVSDNILPAVSLAVSAADGFGSYYLKGVSRATAAATASGAYGSTIVSYSVYGGGYSGTSATLNTGILNVVGTNTFTVTVIDSRGRSKSATSNITVTIYNKPVISSVSCYRSDANKNMAGEGTYITVSANLSITSLTGNAMTVKKAQYRQAGVASWSGNTTLSSGTAAIIASGISTAYAYDVLITLTDTVGKTTTYQTSVPPSSKLFDFRNDRAALGRTAATTKRFMLPPDWGFEYQGQVVGVPANPNLLINSNFQIWQRGNGPFTAGLSADRWNITWNAGGTSSIVKISDGLRFSNSGGTSRPMVRQYLEHGIIENGKTYALSIGLVNGTIYSGSVVADEANYRAVYFGNHSIALGKNTTNAFWCFIIYCDMNSTLDVKWCKLEPGPIATPFIPRPYAEELAMCQRYYENSWFPFNATYVDCHLAQCWATNNADARVDFQITKRVVPTVTIIPEHPQTNIYYFATNSTYYTAASSSVLTRGITKGVMIRFVKSASDVSTWATGQVIQTRFHWEADAEIY